MLYDIVHVHNHNDYCNYSNQPMYSCDYVIHIPLISTFIQLLINVKRIILNNIHGLHIIWTYGAIVLSANSHITYFIYYIFYLFHDIGNIIVFVLLLYDIVCYIVCFM